MRIRPAREIDALLATLVVDAHVAPGATACVCHRRDAGWMGFAGSAGHYAPNDQRAVNIQTYYDIASITKPLTAFCVARLAQHHVLQVDAPLERYVPQYTNTPAGGASLEQLLSHRAGLKPHIELFEPLKRGIAVNRDAALLRCATARRAECNTAAESDDGYPPLYSDLGYLLVGDCLERLTATPLDDLTVGELKRCGVHGVGSARQLTRQVDDFVRRVAPTEVVAYRGGLVRGRVHDDNAWALGGEASCGHAGLFATAEGIATFGCLMLDCIARRRQALTDQSLSWLLRPRIGGSLRAGFDGKSTAGSASGDRFGPRSFGHLGFTGTSLWCDPDAEIVCVVLSNRVCPSRDNIAIRRARPTLHSALVDLAG